MHENELTKIVIGESIKVHSQLGPGLWESVYLEFLSFRLINGGLRIQKQKPIPVVIDGVKLECGFRCDLFVGDKLIIEVKAIDAFKRYSSRTGSYVFEVNGSETWAFNKLQCPETERWRKATCQ